VSIPAVINSILSISSEYFLPILSYKVKEIALLDYFLAYYELILLNQEVTASGRLQSVVTIWGEPCALTMVR